FQQTVVTQYHPPFSAAYSGANSLGTDADIQTSLTTTLFLGGRLWQGAEIYFDPELAGGAGLSGAHGIGGFTNGETFRIGDPKPEGYIARLYIKQTFALGDEYDHRDEDQNQLAGKEPQKYVALTFGKFSMEDFFDDNKYTHDPRTQFLNWGLMSNGAWDYPANTRGYTWGFVAEYVNPDWALRFSGVLVPNDANGDIMDMRIVRSNSETIELQKNFTLGGRKGSVRLLGFFTQADMGSYAEAVAMAPAGNADITQTRELGRTKYGAGLDIEQELADNLGLFFRTSWNDGNNETWMFTEIDQTASAGVLLNGASWGRNDDNLGVAAVVDQISKNHQAYLNDGGYGFMLGDGKLTNEAPEAIAEVYYSYRLHDDVWLSADYQFVLNPGYNADRGPVHVFALRAHTEF
ncbi:MAG TPA: carbohydrate porin, partial [Candidatus Kapabacteria bacterium]|nr:carbohydrate porin [Candidatus Kapabacteria bacterium]